MSIRDQACRCKCAAKDGHCFYKSIAEAWGSSFIEDLHRDLMQNDENGGNTPYRNKHKKSWRRRTPQRFLRSLVAENLTQSMLDTWAEYSASEDVSPLLKRMQKNINTTKWAEEKEMRVALSVLQIRLVVLELQNGRTEVSPHVLRGNTRADFRRLQLGETCGEPVLEESEDDKFIILVRCVKTRDCQSVGGLCASSMLVLLLS